MGRIDVDVDLNGVTSDIKRSIKDGIRDSDEALYEEGTEVAKSKLRQEGAVWKGELINSFTFETAGNGSVRIVKIQNTSDHARPMEEGAEYGEKGPPIDSLLPWVQSKLSGWQVSEYWVGLAEEHLDMPKSMFEANKKLYGKAFWLQQHIKRQGLEPREFMDAMENYLDEEADRIVGSEIDKALRTRL